MKKILIFDMSGVWLKGSFFQFLKTAYSILQKPYTYIPPNAEIMPKEFFLGKLDAKDAFEHALNQKLTESEYEKIVHLWKNNWKLDSDCFALLQNLKSKGYTLVCLTNSDPLNFPVYMQRGYFDPFVSVIASHEVSMIKPQKEIFELACKSVGAKPQDCIYFDDQQRLVTAAKDVGMSAYKFSGISSCLNILKKEGIVLDEYTTQ
jgi:HAD superfamily hydrolase (TIGR01509 family)